jgi:hypothetical protein
MGRLALRAGWSRPDLENEIGYVNRMIELAQKVGASM